MHSLSSLFVFIVLAMKVCCGIIVDDYNDNRQDISAQSYNNNDDYYNDYEDEYSKRRHKKKKRPCPTNKIAPNGKTLINLYYSDVNVAESTHNYHGGGGGHVSHDNYPSNGLGCGLGIGSGGVNQIFPNRPGLLNQNKPGILSDNGNRVGLIDFLNRLLFGDSKPYNDDSLTASAVSVEEEDNSSSTGPLGGTVPDKIRMSAYNINTRRAYRQFNRELDSFLQPFYRLF